VKKRRTPREPAEMLPEDTATALWEPRKRNAPAPDAAVVWPSSALKTAHRGACKQCQAFGLVTAAGFCVLCV
jgi:hypothetical protein